MFSNLRCASVRRESLSLARGIAASALIAIALAGCSADVTRFDGAFGLTESPAATHASSRRNASRPIVTEAPLSSAGGYEAPAPAPAYGSDRGGMTVSSLPDTPRVPSAGTYDPAPAPASVYTPPPPSPAETRAVAPVTPSRAPRTASAGNTIEVQPGDTISGLARKHNVAISELMSANNLRSPAIKPGQQLALPRGARRSPAAREAAAPPPVRSAAAPAPVSSPAVPPRRDWAASYTVKPGESLYSIARKYNVKSADLQKANAILDVHKVRPGTVLKVPGAASTGDVAAPAEVAHAPERAPAATRSSPRAAEAPPAPLAEPVAGSEPAARPRVINGAAAAATQLAAATDTRETVVDAAPLARPAPVPVAAAPASPKAGGPNKLRWPVRGKVVAGFGRLTDGTHNDGVNIQVPAGTDVLAAEAGVVAYAGNEVKGYGNLVLIRHDNGWVTAYAHNDAITVQRGDRVRRGQPVAKVGKTGSVEAPQLHFELRQGSKPVDPLPFMERL